jgi:hypothetical protein
LTQYRRKNRRNDEQAVKRIRYERLGGCKKTEARRDASKDGRTNGRTNESGIRSSGGRTDGRTIQKNRWKEQKS